MASSYTPADAEAVMAATAAADAKADTAAKVTTVTAVAAATNRKR